MSIVTTFLQNKTTMPSFNSKAQRIWTFIQKNWLDRLGPRSFCKKVYYIIILDGIR